MNNQIFVGRHNELQLLDSLWESDRAALLILYGRRRVGKTRLLTHWLKQHSGKGIYWVAEPTSALDQLRSFSQALYNYTTPDSPAPLDFTYANWEQAFRQVAMMASQERMALFIDELPYLIDVNPSLTGILQKAWDHWMSKSNLILALSGSQMGLMQKLLSYEAPLYGRATAQVKLPPLPFSATKLYFPNWSVAERVALYAVWGGVPAYWERLDPNATVLENVRDQLLPSNNLMQEEPRLLLQDFISDPHNYVGILRAIASGTHTNNLLSKRTGLAKGHISKYLSVLRGSGFVTRAVPITEDASKSRRGRYYVTDPYLRFHYHFLSAYQAKMALGEQQQMLNYIEDTLPVFVEVNTWTELCREWVLRASANEEIPMVVDEIGGAWVRQDEISVVGINRAQNQLILGTVHWQETPATASVIEAMVRKASAIIPPEAAQWKVYFVGFCKAGWSEEAHSTAQNLAETASGKHWYATGARLIDLNEVDSDLSRWAQLSLEQSTIQP